jgi:hypothetical protein
VAIHGQNLNFSHLLPSLFFSLLCSSGREDIGGATRKDTEKAGAELRLLNYWGQLTSIDF